MCERISMLFHTWFYEPVDSDMIYVYSISREYLVDSGVLNRCVLDTAQMGTGNNTKDDMTAENMALYFPRKFTIYALLHDTWYMLQCTGMMIHDNDAQILWATSYISAQLIISD